MSRKDILQNLFSRCNELAAAEDAINKLCDEAIETLTNGGTLFLDGNGGSACDSEHLAGELLKGFCSLRPLENDIQKKFDDAYGDEGKDIAGKLQKGLKCISLLSHPAYASAFANDVDSSLIYAQQLNALGKANDMVIGFSTSGNAENIRKLFMTARILNIKTALFTGAKCGKSEIYADIAIHAAEHETYKIQEQHLPLYHAFALILEEHFFGGI
jgi:D-sedoheptulose 7-phosphate isomerase